MPRPSGEYCAAPAARKSLGSRAANLGSKAGRPATKSCAAYFARVSGDGSPNRPTDAAPYGFMKQLAREFGISTQQLHRILDRPPQPWRPAPIPTERPPPKQPNKSTSVADDPRQDIKGGDPPLGPISNDIGPWASHSTGREIYSVSPIRAPKLTGRKLDAGRASGRRPADLFAVPLRTYQQANGGEQIPIMSVAFAIALAKDGLPVFPVLATKAPACSGGHKAAAMEISAVVDLWRRHPAPLIGVPTGQISGIRTRP